MSFGRRRTCRNRLFPGPGFRNYWKKNFPLLRIRAKAEDTCGECHIVANRWKYSSFRDFVEKAAIPTNTDAADLLAIIRASGIDFEGDEGGDGNDAGDVSLLEEALKHVQSAKKQRELHNSAHQAATASFDVFRQHAQRHFLFKHVKELGQFNQYLHLAFTGDYCQNLGLPYLGSEQFGDAYYFSPYSVFCFGIADQSRVSDRLTSYVYGEDEARKGADNVVSCLFKFLTDNELLNANRPIGSITFTFDNCSGQNKNKMMLRFMAWLVEKGFFMQTRLIFLIRGHTKNTCDRLFNLLKQLYRHLNIYSFQALLEALNTHEQIEAIHMPASDHLQWDQYLSGLYKKPKAGIKKQHVFKFDCSEPGIMKAQEVDGEEWKTDRMKKGNVSANQRAALLSAQPAAHQAPGLKAIKQLEMWNKWRKFVPREERKDWWFLVEPSQELQAAGRSDRSERAALRRNAPVGDAAAGDAAGDQAV